VIETVSPLAESVASSAYFDRVRRDALGEEPLPLGPADPNLLGEVLSGIGRRHILLGHGTTLCGNSNNDSEQAY
jgi:hypothetical protein